MKKVYLSTNQVVVDKDHLAAMERRAQCEWSYRQATNFMTGYIQGIRRQLAGNPTDLERARLKGQLDAITVFNKKVVDYTYES